jgi:hypothetical protein
MFDASGQSHISGIGDYCRVDQTTTLYSKGYSYMYAYNTVIQLIETIWKDPVWSKIIAAAIIALAGLLFKQIFVILIKFLNRHKYKLIITISLILFGTYFYEVEYNIFSYKLIINIILY